MIPRFGDPPIAGIHYVRRPGVYAILPLGKSVLLTVQYDDAPDIQLPGGGIDPGESTVQALHREVLEETGWIIRGPRRVGTYKRFVFMPEYDLWAEKICHIYSARPVRKISDPLEKHHKPLWVSHREAVHILKTPGDTTFLKRYFGPV